ncbi:MAG: hypothetical protein D6693_01840 [Planctomycetota bacterium]|nr:MAG: hypothetical protein D6693_01840 [Planctomycetota bacterium]
MRRKIRHKPRPFKNWRRGLRHAVRLRLALAAGRRVVLDHQVGKVGSLSVARAIGRIPGTAVFHSHWIPPRDLAAGPRTDAERALMTDQDPYGFGPRLWRHVLTPGRPVDVVTLVRDPVARNISWYFDLLDKFWRVRDAHRVVPAPRLHAEFFDRFDHDAPVRWFDDQIREVYGIDVYDHPFDPGVGWAIIDQPPVRLLVLRTEATDDAKARAIEAFFDRPAGSVSIPARNVSAAKPHAAAYDAFRRTVALPEAYLERMYGSRMARHFFAPEELDRLRARWRRSPAVAPA